MKLKSFQTGIYLLIINKEHCFASMIIVVITIRRTQLFQHQLRHPIRLAGFAGDGEKAAVVVQQFRVYRPHLAASHKGFGIMIGQKADADAAEYQGGDGFLIGSGHGFVQLMVAEQIGVG